MMSAKRSLVLLFLVGAAPLPFALAEPQAPSAAAIEAVDASKLSRGSLSTKAYAFKKQVYELHVARNIASGKTRIFDLPSSELTLISATNISMRSDAAAKLSEMLQAARADLALNMAVPLQNDAETQRRNLAKRVRDFSVGNAYRSASSQFKIWNGNFAKYYAATAKERQKLAGGEHGEAAAKLLRDYIATRVAAPGFSNHQGGIAVDFKMRLKAQGSKPAQTLSADMKQNDSWRASWFWQWLDRRAGEFGFVEYKPEAWHWEYKPEEVTPKP